MRIPSVTKNPRYYLAVSSDKAFNSRPSFDETKELFHKFAESANKEPHYFKKDFESIIGIVAVSQYGRVFIPRKNIDTHEEAP